MKFSDLEIGMKVYDRWWPEWGTGVVFDVLKTRVLIEFPDEDLVYDKAHVQFLQREGK